MPPLEKRLHLLLATGRPPEELASALIAALDHAEPDEREPIAESLLTLDVEAGFDAVLRLLPQLEASSIRRTLEVAASPALKRALATALQSANLRRQLAVLDLIQHRGDLGLIENIAQLVDGSKDSLPDTAAGIFLSVIVQHAGPRGRGRLAPSQKAIVDRACADVIDRALAHRQFDAMFAVALLLPQSGAMVRKRLRTQDHPGAMALRSVVRRIDEPLVRRNMLHWLRIEPLDRSVLRWMHRITGADGFADLLDGGHLLLHPARRRAIRRVDRPMQCLPHLRDAVRIDERVQHRLPDLVMSLPISTSRQVAMLVDHCALPSPLARLRCALALEGPAGSGSIDAAEAMDRFTFDRDPMVVSAAGARRLHLPESPTLTVLEQLEQRAEEAVASEASLRVASASLDAFIERVQGLAPTAAHIAALACLERDRTALMQKFSERLVEGSARALRLRIIHLVRRLRIGPFVAEALLHCTNEGDAHVASAAISALDAVDAQPVRDALERLMRHHPEPRVRANAMETLSRLNRHHDRTHIELEAFDHASDNRLRANAIRSMIECGSREALARLGVMLRDDRPLHRVSALWVARQVRARTLLRTIRRVADEDASGEIRLRAARIARFLAAQRENFTDSGRRGQHAGSISATTVAPYEHRPVEALAG